MCVFLVFSASYLTILLYLCNPTMKISIVTATYNRAKTLRETLDSVLAQTHRDIEHIIVDGGSTDGTVELIKEYEARYNGRLKWVSEKDKGVYDAMNKGMKMATGDLVGFLNSDDLYSDSHVLEDINRTMENTDVDCVFGDLILVSQNDTTKVVRYWNGSPYRPGIFKKGWQPAHPTFYMKREFLEIHGGFDISIEVSADFDLMFRYLEIHHLKSSYIPRVLVRMRVGGESNGEFMNVVRGNMNILRCFRNNGYDPGRFYLVRRLIPKVWDVIKQKASL